MELFYYLGWDIYIFNGIIADNYLQQSEKEWDSRCNFITVRLKIIEIF